MLLTIDFETRSPADIRKTGAFAYAMHPDTDVICLALKADDGDPVIYYPNHPELSSVSRDGVAWLICTAAVIEAHNAHFEYAMWKYCFAPKYGAGVFPDSLPKEKLRCSMARVAAMGLPLSLDEACRALGVAQQKDMEGSRLMLKMCRPLKPTKAQLAKEPDWDSRLHWLEDEASLKRLGEYCMQDVNAEHDLSSHTRPLSPAEQALWVRDLEINDRGVPLDLESIGIIDRAVDRYVDRLTLEFGKITGLAGPGQVAAFIEWLAGKGVEVKDLQKSTVDSLLAEEGLDPDVRRALEIRRSACRTSNAKYKAFQACACPDGRVRGSLQFHGAATGRWSGRLIQPQNFPRGSVSDVEACIRSFHLGIADRLYGDVTEAASSCLRGMIMAPEGYYFACADYSAIEGRVLAWLAGDEDALNVYRNGLDAYLIAASAVFDRSYDELKAGVDSGDRDCKALRQRGKVAELALGYQGGWNALNAMAAGYGMVFEEEEAKRMVKAWRDSRPVTTGFWNELEAMVVKAVGSRGTVVQCRRVSAWCDGPTLNITLPSGRLITYMYPKIKMDRTPWGAERPMVYFFGVDSMTHKWCEKDLYGGLIAENITQAVARDILANALMGISCAVFHIHDECVAIVPDRFTDHDKVLKALTDTMCMLPDWAEGLPLKAEGWTGRRYKK